MSDSVRPQRQQPTQLRCPWDSPGKNTGVGCHFLLQCMKVKSESEVAQLCPTPSNPMDCSPPGSSIHWICQARILEWVPIAFSVLTGHESSKSWKLNAYTQAHTSTLTHKHTHTSTLRLTWVFCVLMQVCVSHSVAPNSATPSTAAHQAPPSMGFARQEYWSGVPLPSLFSLVTSPQKAGNWMHTHKHTQAHTHTHKHTQANLGLMCPYASVCQSVSRIQLFATPSTAAHQAPLPMGFSRQGYWSG